MYLTLLAAWLAFACLVPSAPADERADSSAAAEDSQLDPGVSREDLPREAPRGPLTVFAAIEAAWAEEDVEALVALLDPEDRVQIAMANAGPRGGWFNRDQAYFLVQDMFSFTKTRRFEFERYWNLDSRGRSPYAVALRELGTEAGPRTDRVYISLRKRGEDAWYIGEIRCIDP